MRIIKYIEIQEKKEVSNEEHINELVKDVYISVPCKVNLYLSSNPKVEFNQDRSLFHYNLKDGKLSIKKSNDIIVIVNENETVDLYLNDDVKNIIINGKTNFIDHNHGRYQSIQAEDDTKVEIKELLKQDFSLTVLDNCVANVKSSLFVDNLYLTAKGNSKIDAIGVNTAYLKSFTSGMSNISATTSATIDAELLSMSSQKIYGEPTEVNKTVSDIGTFTFVENLNDS